MSYTVKQRFRGETQFGPRGGSLWYVVRSDDPENDDVHGARAAVESTAPSVQGGFTTLGAELTELVKMPHAAAWMAEVRYGGGSGFTSLPPTLLTGFTGALSTDKMTKGFEVVAGGGSGGTSAPDRDGLIGINGDGQAEGVDVMRPVFTRTFTNTLPINDVEAPGGHAEAWLALLGTVNSNPYLGFPPGTVLFQGLSAEKQSTNQYAVRVELGYRPTETNIQIGDGMTLATLEGWDYLEIVPMLAWDAAKQIVISQADYYYVHRLYRRAAFANLGIEP